MPLYRQRYTARGPAGDEQAAYRYTDRRGRGGRGAGDIPAEIRPPAPPPEPAAARDADSDTIREQLMAQLEQQIAGFGERLAALEARTADVVASGDRALRAVRTDLDAMARTVAAIEAHDARRDARLTALEARAIAADDRLDAIEATLGVLGIAAAEVAAKDSHSL